MRKLVFLLIILFILGCSKRETVKIEAEKMIETMNISNENIIVQKEHTPPLISQLDIEDINIIKQLICGFWSNPPYYYIFFDDGTYNYGIYHSSYSGYGYWEIDNNKIVITRTHIIGLYDEEEAFSETEYQYEFIDEKLILTGYEDNKLTKRIFINRTDEYIENLNNGIGYLMSEELIKEIKDFENNKQ